MSDLRVIGVDPSLSSTGLAYDNDQLATIKTKPDAGDHRLQPIYDAVYAAAGSGLWRDMNVLAILEDLPVNAMSAGKTGQSQGVVRLALVAAGASIISIPPATLKKYAVGKGNAKKKEMVQEWNKAFPDHQTKDDNQVDAGFLREYGRQLRQAIEIPADVWEAYQNDISTMPNVPAKFLEHIEIARKTAAGQQLV